MNEKEIDGLTLKKILMNGYFNLKANAKTINDLNVFPIPDGDTGDNMSATLLGAVNELKDNDEDVLGKASLAAEKGMLLSARGNSGVILSQMFAGIFKEFATHEKADVQTLANAYDNGVKHAYSAVSVPVEGTMLTVLRESSSYARSKISKESTIESYFLDFTEEAERSVTKTPELLPVLREAGVVDSGGMGIVYITKGFIKALRDEPISAVSEISDTTNKDLDFSLFNENSVMKYGYCTEFLLQLTNSKTDIENFSLESMEARLKEMGDSIVSVKINTIVKVHIHTMHPGTVLDYAQNYGEFLTLKVENMTLQHNNETKGKPRDEFKKNLSRKRYGLIAVADGEGLSMTYKELGADLIINGGQGNNPSVDIFLKAFDAINCDNIIVLPNNSNIQMAAHEAAELYKESNVKVINSKSLGDGYTALAALDYTPDNIDDIVNNLEREIKLSTCAMISKATRDVTLNGVEIKDGNYIGFLNKDILISDENRLTAALNVTEKLDANKKEFLVVFYGKDVDENEVDEYKQTIQNKYPNIELYTLNGGQEIYDYVIIIQ